MNYVTRGLKCIEWQNKHVCFLLFGLSLSVTWLILSAPLPLGACIPVWATRKMPAICGFFSSATEGLVYFTTHFWTRCACVCAGQLPFIRDHFFSPGPDLDQWSVFFCLWETLSGCQHHKASLGSFQGPSTLDSHGACACPSPWEEFDPGDHLGAPTSPWYGSRLRFLPVG